MVERFLGQETAWRFIEPKPRGLLQMFFPSMASA